MAGWAASSRPAGAASPAAVRAAAHHLAGGERRECTVSLEGVHGRDPGAVLGVDDVFQGDDPLTLAAGPQQRAVGAGRARRPDPKLNLGREHETLIAGVGLEPGGALGGGTALGAALGGGKNMPSLIEKFQKTSQKLEKP